MLQEFSNQHSSYNNCLNSPHQNRRNILLYIDNITTAQFLIKGDNLINKTHEFT